MWPRDGSTGIPPSRLSYRIVAYVSGKIVLAPGSHDVRSRSRVARVLPTAHHAVGVSRLVPLGFAPGYLASPLRGLS